MAAYRPPLRHWLCSFWQNNVVNRDVRAEKVEEILFFSQRGTLDLEGVCLVSYK